MENVLVTGATGMDGSYLCELLLDKGYKVIGLKRRTSTENLWRLENCMDHEHFVLEEGDIIDYVSMFNIINKYRPVQIYNTAAQSHVKTSFEQPFYTIQCDLYGPLNILESIRYLQDDDYRPKFLQCSTSEMFGNNYKLKGTSKKFQNIDTEFSPRSPYGVAKLAAHELVKIYRDAYKIFACSSICFNHEGARRGPLFVTKKITMYVADLFWSIKLGHDISSLQLGNLDSYRDWSDARDMVRAMYMMLEQKEPKDYVVSSDLCYSVREFVEQAFSYIGIKDYMNHIEINPKFFRPAEVDYLCGDSSKIRQELGWKPQYSFKDLVRSMVEYDIEHHPKYNKNLIDRDKDQKTFYEIGK